MYKLSGRSLNKLEGVHPTMVDTVKRAIELSKVDFGVIYGVRSLAEQKRLYEAGRSQTMKSKHLVQEDGYSHAVDLMAYDGSDPSWDIVMYDDIADAMKAAAKETGAKIRWGAAWTIDNIAEWERPMQDAMNNYIDVRRKSGRTPFIDGPHFELN
jgi:peptidoglycan L-alanyl-D-glutamate endopeptidase CwlK|tara:strand:+ start:544 stop:1008 length:465 start_codon:yes stop_codon:yes gene_type:complete